MNASKISGCAKDSKTGEAWFMCSVIRARFQAINDDRNTGNHCREDEKRKDDRPKDPIHEEPQVHRAKPRVSTS